MPIDSLRAQAALRNASSLFTPGEQRALVPLRREVPAVRVKPCPPALVYSALLAAGAGLGSWLTPMLF